MACVETPKACTTSPSSRSDRQKKPCCSAQTFKSRASLKTGPPMLNDTAFTSTHDDTSSTASVVTNRQKTVFVGFIGGLSPTAERTSLTSSCHIAGAISDFCTRLPAHHC